MSQLMLCLLVGALLFIIGHYAIARRRAKHQAMKEFGRRLRRELSAGNYNTVNLDDYRREP